MARYANRNRRSDGVLHPIQVSTLALAVGESAPILVVTFDLVGIHTAQIARICAAINEATGVDPQRILIACSHTHFAPSTGPQRLTDSSLGIQDADDAYVAVVVRRTVEACAGAIGSLARPGYSRHRPPSGPDRTPSLRGGLSDPTCPNRPPSRGMALRNGGGYYR